MIYTIVKDRLKQHNLTPEKVLLAYVGGNDVEMEAIFNQIYQWLYYECKEGLELTRVALDADDLARYFVLQTEYRKEASTRVQNRFNKWFDESCHVITR